LGKKKPVAELKETPFLYFISHAAINAIKRCSKNPDKPPTGAAFSLAATTPLLHLLFL